MSNIHNDKIFGLIKTVIDAHTLGLRAAASLLLECGFPVYIADKSVETALLSLEKAESQIILIDWIKEKKITNLGFSYRLDPDDAVKYLNNLVNVLIHEGLYGRPNSQIKRIHFAGLLPACNQIDKKYNLDIVTFRGGEDAETSLKMMGIPKNKIPKSIVEGCSYDKQIEKFGKKVIEEGKYKYQKSLTPKKYSEFGTKKDSLIKRLDYNFEEGFNPLIRAHSGPYRSDLSREDCVEEYILWCKELAKNGFLDILSIGTSQLSQSRFGDNWEGLANGGGVPINSEEEYRNIWEAAYPMLVRTYSGTSNVKNMARIYDNTINNAWHALSLWWFNELDGRGPNTLYSSLSEHIETIKYISENDRVFEANVPHHFAFRGCDDVTYIVTSVLSAKLAKKMGIRTFVLQNMLNTPRSTWGIRDIAKSRVLLKLVSELSDQDFRVVLQTRAGLDYFKPDINVAKEQLATITALMDDIEPYNDHSPDIIHVVSYSEAVSLATPSIIDESIKITRQALYDYRCMKKEGTSFVDDFEKNIKDISEKLENDANRILCSLEENIDDLYSPKGLFIAFVAGWFPVPELWSDSEDFIYAKKWYTCMKNGGSILWNTKTGKEMEVEERIKICCDNIPFAKKILDKYI